ncbi:sec-independent protein translocase tatA/E-like protein [Paraglaciecola hydrolytica]|uniref:Sec-independent protein translocase protein TatA n=2 Tax=Paraglaciecola hydrolytica TaxID=1799789 RepID=A0A148KLK4_9ALTE|nr:sec-independent protein translocase tatA/E-like protein [Paraglaciecola hydrolytica]
MGMSMWQIVLVVILFLLLFGRGKIPALMSDLAEGIKGFKKGMVDESEQHGKTASEHKNSNPNIAEKPSEQSVKPNTL